jgi:phosphoribosylaminoimidazole-succinocarboxamide synthase
MLAQESVITAINLPKLKLFKQGKVRNVYDFGSHLLIVASDRVSAFDVVLPNGIPNKGQTLTTLSKFWFDLTKDIVPNHLISTDVADFPDETALYHDILRGRSMLVKKTELLPVECVVRGYIIGSGWKDYQETGEICGIQLRKGLRLAEQLDEPLFTPAFKAEVGEHDENISFANMCDIVGQERANYLKQISLKLYNFGREYALKHGIILADTKFEFGLLGDEIILIDEVLTADSSRYWPKNEYEVGSSPPSFDKQIVRDYLASTSWDKQAPGPQLPQAIIEKTQARYEEILQVLMSDQFVQK